MMTPLFLALLAIGSSDLLFAFDSIPAVFGVTNHAYGRIRTRQPAEETRLSAR